MPTRTEAIRRFLHAYARPDLADLYDFARECQVNVAQDGGERIEGEYCGREWQGWTDGLQTWKPFRIPFNAKDNPSYTDSEMRFDLSVHAESIGMTGWDWQNQVSLWVGFDFDALVGHSDQHKRKLTPEQLQEVTKSVMDIPWVTIRTSTSGRGLHLYVFLDEVPTANHLEHAALARAILGKLSALARYSFESKVDACGGNMWIWGRRQAQNGLMCIREGTLLYDVPANWRDHIHVTRNTRRRISPVRGISESESDIDVIVRQAQHPDLDVEHRKLFEELDRIGHIWWWDTDNYMLVTHTQSLRLAKNHLQLTGVFETISAATNLNEQNCFCFPLKNGAWVVRRYTKGIEEHSSWIQDSAGWTMCYLNKEPTLAIASRSNSGIEDTDGSFQFREAGQAVKAAMLLGFPINVPRSMELNAARLKPHKDGRLIVEIDRGTSHDPLPGWLEKKGTWIRVTDIRIKRPIDDPESSADTDDAIRHIISSGGSDLGWVIFSDDKWIDEPLAHVKAALSANGHGAADVIKIIGSSVLRKWTIVNRPFQPEYLGDREWNRHAAQFKYAPATAEDLKYPTWQKVMDHCGQGLDSHIIKNPWAVTNGIRTGGEYLMCWVASLFQHPESPLPYLFFYGPQDSGKSSFWEGLSKLLTKGFVKADRALTNEAGFNAELLSALLCVVEELDLSRNSLAANRIKDLVTSPFISLHEKRQTPIMVINYTHWVQCANIHTFCPILPGDTRITISYVSELTPTMMIPKDDLMDLLMKEAPHFLAHVLSIEVPPSGSRLRVPIIETEEKSMIAAANRSALEDFIANYCLSVSGARIQFSDFYDRFLSTLDSADIGYWSKKQVSRSLPPYYPKGRDHGNNSVYIGNIWWSALDIPADVRVDGTWKFDDPHLVFVENTEYIEPIPLSNGDDEDE